MVCTEREPAPKFPSNEEVHVAVAADDAHVVGGGGGGGYCSCCCCWCRCRCGFGSGSGSASCCCCCCCCCCCGSCMGRGVARVRDKPPAIADRSVRACPFKLPPLGQERFCKPDGRIKFATLKKTYRTERASIAHSMETTWGIALQNPYSIWNSDMENTGTLAILCSLGLPLWKNPADTPSHCKPISCISNASTATLMRIRIPIASSWQSAGRNLLPVYNLTHCYSPKNRIQPSAVRGPPWVACATERLPRCISVSFEESPIQDTDRTGKAVQVHQPIQRFLIISLVMNPGVVSRRATYRNPTNPNTEGKDGPIQVKCARGGWRKCPKAWNVML